MLKALVLTTALALPLAPALAQQADPGADTLTERVGETVYSPTGEPLAELTEVLKDTGSAPRAVLSYGGMLGVGETEVLVPQNELSVQPGGEAGQPRLVLSMGEDELKALPPYDAKQDEVAATVSDKAEATAAEVSATADRLGDDAQQAVSAAMDKVDSAWGDVQGATAEGWDAARDNFRQAVNDLERTWDDVTTEDQQAERPVE